MQNIVVLYGGESPEHEVSILTGLHLAQHVPEPYRVWRVYLTKTNRFVVGSPNIDDYLTGKAEQRRSFRQWRRVSCVVNCCHGGPGEDGRLAAFLQLLGVPVTGCDPRAALCLQSKILTRQILTAAGFPQPKFVTVTTADPTAVALPLPVIVKPEMLGSSIGVAVAHTSAELTAALQTALTLGSRAIVEEYYADRQEINVALRRENGVVVTSSLETITAGEVYSFADKYETVAKITPKKATATDAPGLPQAAEIRQQAVRAYELLGAAGVVRADFIIAGEQVILNELNAVPGFMAYHLWLRAGVPYGVLINDLITTALTPPKRYLATFNSDILAKNRQLVLEKK